jgi:hypothetical protein
VVSVRSTVISVLIALARSTKATPSAIFFYIVSKSAMS